MAIELLCEVRWRIVIRQPYASPEEGSLSGKGFCGVSSDDGRAYSDERLKMGNGVMTNRGRNLVGLRPPVGPCHPQHLLRCCSPRGLFGPVPWVG